MEIGVLGPLRLAVGGALRTLPPGRQGALLAALALDVGEVVSSDRLIDLIWSDDQPANPANALQGRVSQLRKFVGGDRLRRRGSGYVLDADQDAVDAHRFTKLAQAGREALRDGDPAAAIATLSEALELWRGDALADFSGELWAAAERSRLEELRLATHEWLFEARLATGDHGGVIAPLELLVIAHPLREQLSGQLMRALYGVGRQAEALEVFERLRHSLADELGLDPSPGVQELHASILRQDPELRPSAVVEVSLSDGDTTGRPRSNLPSLLSSFIGRERDVEMAGRLVRRHRLVTLTGPGGVGKTRLAIETAARCRDEDLVADGVWLVELAPVEATAVASTVASTVGLADTGGAPDAVLARLVDHLADARALLVIDNCEHVRNEATALVDGLTRSCPEVRVLATTREALGLHGETLWSVPPLVLPPADLNPTSVDELEIYDATRLFVHRARQRRPELDFGGEEAAAVAEICRRLDGIPLALELAAARCAGMSAVSILERLDQRLDLLRDGSPTVLPRHRTLRAAVEWSWDLLTDSERTVLAALSVFRGGCTLDTVDSVAAAWTASESVDAVADALTSLVAKSLVQLSTTAGYRYQLLETIREFAEDRLAAMARDDIEELHRSHARVHVELARELSASTLGRSRQRESLDRLDREHDNMRAALTWLLAHPDEPALVADAQALAAALAPFWCLRDHRVEGRQWLQRIVDDVPRDVADPRHDVWADVQFWHLWLLLDTYDFDRVAMRLEFVREQLKDPSPRVVAQLSLIDGLVALGITGRLTTTWRPEEACLRADSVFAAASDAEHDDAWLRSVTTLCIGLVAMSRGDAGGIATHAEQALGCFKELGDSWGMAKCRQSLGIAAMLRGETDEAEAHHRAGLAASEQIQCQEAAATILAQLGSVLTLQGRLDDAEAALSRSRRLAAQLGSKPAVAFPLNGLGLVARRRGDADTAADLHRQALERYEQVAHPLGVPYSLASLGLAGCAAGDVDGARRVLTRALRQADDLGEPRIRAMARHGLATVHVAEGDLREARRLLAEADEITATSAGLGAPLVPLPDPHDRDALLVALQATPD